MQQTENALSPKVPPAKNRADASDYSADEAPKDKARPRKKPRGSGITGSRYLYGSFVDDEKNTALKSEKAYETYDLMRRTDTDVYQALEILKNPMLACPFVIEPASDEPIDREIADFVASNLFEDLPWASINRESLLRFDYGCYLFEQLTEVGLVERQRFPNLPTVRSAGRPARGEMVPAVRWKAFEPRHPRTVRRWVQDPELTTRLDRVVQWFEGDDTRAAGEYEIPAADLIRFTHCQEAANFAGRSVLRPMFADYRESNHLRKVETVRHERQNCGLPVARAPENPDQHDIDDIEETLEALSSYEQSYLIIPFGWDFKFDTSGEGAGTGIAERLRDLRRSKLDTVLGGFMTLGQEGVGSNALISGQKDTQIDYVEVNVRFTESVWNKGSDGMAPIRVLVDLNYGKRRLELGSRGYPKLRAKNVRGRHYLQVMKLLATLAQAKLITITPAIQRFVLQALEIDGPSIVAGDEGDDQRGAREEEKPADKQQAQPAEEPVDGESDETDPDAEADSDETDEPVPPAPKKKPAARRKGVQR